MNEIVNEAMKLDSILARFTAVTDEHELAELCRSCRDLDDLALVPPLVAHKNHGAVSVRRAVVEGLSFKNSPLVRDALVELSHDVDEQVRRGATFYLAEQERFTDENTHQALLARLTDENAEIRGEALVGLARRKSAETLAALLIELQSDEVCPQVIEAALELGHPDCRIFLWPLLWYWDGEGELLADAVAACAPAEETPVDELWKQTCSVDVEAAVAARIELQMRGTDEVFHRALEASRAADWEQRAIACEVLAGLGGPARPFAAQAKAVLEALLADRDKDVVAEAIQAIDSQGYEDKVRMLLPLQHHPSMEVRVNVANALTGSDDEDALNAFADLACSRERQVRVAVAHALADEIYEGQPLVATTLARLCRDDDPHVRGLALFAKTMVGADDALALVEKELTRQEVDGATLMAVTILGEPCLYDAVLQQRLWLEMDWPLFIDALMACQEERAQAFLQQSRPQTAAEIVAEALAGDDHAKSIARAVRILTYRGTVEVGELAQRLATSEAVDERTLGEALNESLAEWAKGEDPVALGSGWFDECWARLAKRDWHRRIFTADEVDQLSHRPVVTHWTEEPAVCSDGVHIMCADRQKLHEFALVIGLSKRLFSDHPYHPHYDLMTLDARQRAIAAGVVPMSSRQLLRRFPSGRLRSQRREGEGAL